MTCPLVVEGRAVGVLFRSARRPRAFTDRDVRLHLAVAERLSQAVEKAYRIQQLEAANRAYTELLGFVSHELKSPVASIVTDATVFRDGYLGELSPDQKAKMERMIAKGEYLLGLVREYLDLARIESGELRPRFVWVEDFAREVLEPAVDIVLPQVQARKMRLSRHIPPGPVRAQCDPNLLKIVLVNLVDNARKYGREGGEIRLTVTSEPAAIAVSVWNEGAGFPESERSGLFRKFSRLQTAALAKERGTGVGLYTSWRICQLHGGRIEADSREGSWAEFRFALPQPLPPEILSEPAPPA